jgi:hypothetical protein
MRMGSADGPGIEELFMAVKPHRYAVGDRVFVSNVHVAKNSAYTVSQLLPNGERDREYRVKCSSGGPDLVVLESSLSPNRGL